MTAIQHYKSPAAYAVTPSPTALPVDTLAQLLPWAAQRYGNRIAVIVDARSWTFAALERSASQVANALRQCGVKGGDCVSLCAHNSDIWIACYHGILRCGAVINPLNPLLSADELDFAVGDCRARVLLAGGDKLKALVAQGMSSRLETMVSLDGAGPEGSIPFDIFVDGQSERFMPMMVEPASLSTICYTSGTTGRPKGAMQSHVGVVHNAAMTASMHGRKQGDVVLSALPLPHVYGNVVMNSALLSGSTLLLHARFEERAVFASISEHRATILDGVPAMYMGLLNHPSLAGAELGSLRLCVVGGQTMPLAKMEAVVARFGCPLLELWGMTELSGVGTTFFADRSILAGSIGVPLPGVEVRIAGIDDADRTLVHGEVGELMVRGPIVMLGYFGDGAATRETIEPDGWMHTGDIALMDGDGRLHVVDRKKDMIVTAGNNIYPAELERVLAMHPAVAMAAVGPLPDDIKGEIPKAYIVLKVGVSVDPADIMTHCRRHLAAYKIPRQVQFVADLPTTGSGKIMRRALRTLDPPKPDIASGTSVDVERAKAGR